MDPEKRKTIKTLSSLTLGAITAPILLLPKKTYATDLPLTNLKYPDYPIPSDQQLKKIAENPNYPDEFLFYYSIPFNTDYNGNTLSGGMSLEKKLDMLNIAIKINHPSEKRLMLFSKNGKTYYESEFNLKNSKDFYQKSLEPDMPTIPDLVEAFFKGDFSKRKFVFQGKEELLREYKIKEIKKKCHKTYDFMMEAEFEGPDLKVKKLELFCKEILGKIIPVEAWLDYRAKWANIGLTTIYVPHTIRGVLQTNEN